MASWVQHPVTGKLIPRDEYVRPRLNECPAVHGDFESYVSTIDGSYIDDRGKDRRHMKQHGVSRGDYSEQYIKTRRSTIERQEQKKLKESRINDINAAIAQHGG